MDTNTKKRTFVPVKIYIDQSNRHNEEERGEGKKEGKEEIYNSGIGDTFLRF